MTYGSGPLPICPDILPGEIPVEDSVLFIWVPFQVDPARTSDPCWSRRVEACQGSGVLGEEVFTLDTFVVSNCIGSSVLKFEVEFVFG